MGCENSKDCFRLPQGEASGQADHALEQAFELLKRQSQGKAGDNPIVDGAQGLADQAERHLPQIKERIDQAGRDLSRELPKITGEIEKSAEELQRRAGEAAKEIAPALNQFKRDFNRMLDEGAQAVTKVDTDGLIENLRDNFDVLDKDRDGFITKDELQDARKDPGLRFGLAGTLKASETHFDNLQGLNRDAFVWDNNGISRKDLNVLESAKRNGTSLSEAFANAPTLDLKQHGLSGAAAVLAAKPLFRAGAPGKALALGAVAFTAAEAGLGTLSYKLFTAPKANAIITDLQ